MTFDLHSEFRQAWARLRAAPGVTAIAVLTLALAIGIGAALFCVIRTVLLDPLPFAAQERLVQIAASAPGSQLPAEFSVSREFYLHYRERSQLIEDIVALSTFTNTLRLGERVERPRMSMATPSLFSTLGVNPVLGRLPTDDDADNPVLIGDVLWRDWFGRDPNVVGRTIEVFGEARTIIGVMPPKFRFPSDDTVLWIASPIRPSEANRPSLPGFLQLVARTKPGVTPDALARELTALAAELPERFGGSAAFADVMRQHRAVVRPLEETLLGEYRRPLWLLFGAAGIVLLIACANVANLLLVRAEGRQRELAVRRALGAGRAQLLRMQLAEALLIAAMAAVLAVGLAALSLPLLLHAAPAGIPRLGEVGIDAATVLFAIAAALLAGLACGVVPALRSAPDLARLRDGGRGTTGRGHRLRQWLVAGQTALALVLLIGAGLLLRSVQALQQVDPGYDGRDVFTFQIAPELPDPRDVAAYARFDLRFLERLAALPGVESAGLVENIPIDEGTASVRVRNEHMGMEAENGLLLNFTYTAGDYFRTMRIPLLSGRVFNADDHGAAPGHVIVSRAAAERLWPGQDPIGRRLQRQGQTEWETVIGVVGDVMQNGPLDGRQAVIYLPLVGPSLELSRPISSPAYVVRTAQAASIAPRIRELVREIAPEAPMYRAYTMDELMQRAIVRQTFTLLTMGLAAVLALVLGAVGLYGVLSQVVAERSREIGVRMALGARAEQVRAMVVAQGARVVGLGVAFGLAVAFTLSHMLGSLLFGISPLDPAAFAAMPLALIAVSLLASYLPARRASIVDPMQALRRD